MILYVTKYVINSTYFFLAVLTRFLFTATFISANYSSIQYLLSMKVAYYKYEQILSLNDVSSNSNLQNHFVQKKNLFTFISHNVLFVISMSSIF